MVRRTLYICYVVCFVNFLNDIVGVKKEDIRVEVEDSKYLIIRTEGENETTEEPVRCFMKKFRLPVMIDVNGISAGYEDGVLTVTVPRFSAGRGFYIEPADVSEQLGVLARAA